MAGVLQLLVETAFAQPSSLPTPPECFNFFNSGTPVPNPGDGFTCFGEYGKALTFVIIGFSASIALVMLMINGFRYMLGPAAPGGSSDAAKKGIQFALVGLAVSLLAYIILDTLVYSVTL